MRALENSKDKTYQEILDNLSSPLTRYQQSTLINVARQAWAGQPKLIDIIVSFLSEKTLSEIVALHFNEEKMDALFKARDTDGNSLHHWAAIANRDDVVSMLLNNGFGLHAMGIFKLNILQLAILLNSKKVVFHILNFYGDFSDNFKIIIENKEVLLNTLQLSILFGNMEIINKIISRYEKKSIQLNWNVDIGGNLLHLAVLRNDPDILAYLLSKILSSELKEMLLHEKWFGLSVVEHAKKNSGDCLSVLEKDFIRSKKIAEIRNKSCIVPPESTSTRLLGVYVSKEKNGFFCCASEQIKKFDIEAIGSNITFSFPDNNMRGKNAISIPKIEIEKALLYPKKIDEEKTEICVSVTHEKQYQSQSPMVFLHAILEGRDKTMHFLHLVFDKNEQLYKIKIEEQHNDKPRKTLFFAKNIQPEKFFVSEIRSQMNTNRQPENEPYDYKK